MDQRQIELLCMGARYQLLFLKDDKDAYAVFNKWLDTFPPEVRRQISTEVHGCYQKQKQWYKDAEFLHQYCIGK